MNKLNVVILSAGKATRLEPITTYIPKCLVNIGSKTALLQQIEYYNEHFDVNRFDVIVNQEFVAMVEGYIEANGIKNVYVHGETKQDGSLNTIFRYLYNRQPAVDYDTIWNWADIIPQSKMEINRRGRNASIITHGNKCRFRYSEVLKCAQPSDNGDVIGIYYTPSRYLYFLTIDPYGFMSQDFVRIFELKALTERCEEVYKVPIEKVLDFGDMEKFKKATENIGHERAFNEVTIMKQTVEKKALDKKGLELQEDEISWYEDLEESKITPSLLGVVNNTMVLQKLNGSPLSKITKGKFKVVIKAINALQKLHTVKEPMVVNSKTIIGDIVKEAHTKVMERTQPLEKLLASLGKITHVNGVQIFPEYMVPVTELTKKLTSRFRNSPSAVYNFIHGDPNFSNTFLEDGDIKFIDPRGYFGRTKKFGFADYDIAKVLYACSGYDRFNEDPMFAIKSLKNGQLEFDIEPFLPNFMNLDNVFDEEIYYWLPIIWINLAGYFKNNPLKAFCAYYYGMYLAQLVLKKFDDPNYMANRILLSNEIVPCYNDGLTFSIITKCPKKWLLIDRETGQQYVPDDPTTLHKMWKLQ